ncbi:MAG: glycoside hydrolase family 16 protein [Parvibaculum sp.]|nr:glycoside hydrolase family 16 protein [Parvibaculum sp.]
MKNSGFSILILVSSLLIGGCASSVAQPLSADAASPRVVADGNVQKKQDSPPERKATRTEEKKKKKTPPPPLDLSAYRLTFNDEFDKMSIVPDKGDGTWFAPVHVTFGAALLAPPSPSGPFFVKDGKLTIRASVQDGKWTSGLMQTVDSTGRGFSQAYGYFEMRAKLPKGRATWPAFWLLTQRTYVDTTATRGEIDILEAYGSQHGVIHFALHIRPRGDRRWNFSKQFKQPTMMEGFHRYGASIDSVWIKFYFDSEEIYRVPTFEVFKGPMYMLVDLAMVDKDMARAESPSDLIVDYVRAYEKIQ